MSVDQSLPTSSNKKTVPLAIWILISLILGALCGHFLIGPGGAKVGSVLITHESFKWISDLVLRVLKLLATPLVFFALIAAISKANISGKKATKLGWLLFSNTVIAIIVGLLVANLLKPGVHIKPLETTPTQDKKPYSIVEHMLNSIPGDFVTPFQSNDIISILLIAIAFGISMRILHQAGGEIAKRIETLQSACDAIFQIVIVVIKWVFYLVPIAVFAVVTRMVAKNGIESLASMLYWVGSVVLALLIMAVIYMIRMYFSTKISPIKFLAGGKDAFVMAFGTASSAATLPVTFKCAIENLRISKPNASMGIMAGGTFNHDGTALYEAMAALMISQVIGRQLGMSEQFLVVFMAIIASVGAAGIPEAGLVTMLAVLNAVGLPLEYVALLLPVDWFLDRCRTTINVMGDLASTTILQFGEGGTADESLATT